MSNQHGHQGQPHGAKRGVHRDWRFWVGMALMLAAIGMYVASLDDGVVPGSETPVEEGP